MTSARPARKTPFRRWSPWRPLLLVGSLALALTDQAVSAPRPLRPAPQGEIPSVQRVHSSSRSLSRAFDVALGGRPGAAAGVDHSLFLLIDPTASVQSSGVAAALAASLRSRREQSKSIYLTVLRAGRVSEPVLRSSQDPEAVVAAVETVLSQPDAAFRNLCADLRELADRAANLEGSKDVLVVSFDNPDVEHEVEKTGERLRRGDWRCFFLTRETPLSDSYWDRTSNFASGKPPADSLLHGSDGPFVDFPYPILFQGSFPNEQSPSGFAPWMTSRLATMTEGTVFLFAPSDSSSHSCSQRGACRFCPGDHRPPRETFLGPQLARLAPPAGSRAEAGSQAAKDPMFRLVASAWEDACKEGLMMRSPPFKLRGNQLRMQPSRPTRRLPLAGAHSFDSTASVARESRRDCEKLIATLEAGIARHRGDEFLPRYHANAEYLLLAMQVTRFNLFHLELFCDELGGVLRGKVRRDFEPPEVAPFQEDQSFKGVAWYDVSLCHGAAVLHRLHLPGEQRMDQQIDALDTALRQFQQRWAHSPYAIAAARLQIPIFYTSMGTFGSPPRTRPTSSTQRAETRTARPQRGSVGSGGTSSGATTGGGG